MSSIRKGMHVSACDPVVSLANTLLDSMQAFYPGQQIFAIIFLEDTPL